MPEPAPERGWKGGLSKIDGSSALLKVGASDGKSGKQRDIWNMGRETSK